MDIGELAELLRDSEQHHGAYEAVAPPHHWSDWYAAYITARRGGSTPEEAVDAAGRYMVEVKGVAAL